MAPHTAGASNPLGHQTLSNAQQGMVKQREGYSPDLRLALCSCSMASWRSFSTAARRSRAVCTCKYHSTDIHEATLCATLPAGLLTSILLAAWTPCCGATLQWS